MSAKEHSKVFAAVVFGAVVLLTAGVVAPASAGDGVDDEARAAAQAQAASYAESLRGVLADCSAVWFDRLEHPPLRLYGPGVLPEEPGEDARASFPLSGVVLRDELGLGSCWRGPYGEPLSPDPWGRAWIVRFSGPTGPVLILSAGPDGIVDSGFGAVVSEKDAGAVLLR